MIRREVSYLMNRLTKFLAAAALSATLVFGQGPRGMGRGPGANGGNPPDVATRVQMRVNMLATQLGLTDDQKARATTIFTDAANAVQTVHTNMQAAHTALEDAVKKNNPGAIDTAAGTIGTLTTQLVSTESKAEAAFYSILTPDQQTKYDSRPHGGGFGGGMGPRGFGGRQLR
jgi:Spy/CpxP family protein refolding chaperone